MIVAVDPGGIPGDDEAVLHLYGTAKGYLRVVERQARGGDRRLLGTLGGTPRQGDQSQTRDEQADLHGKVLDANATLPQAQPSLLNVRLSSETYDR
jgi:hypothetical protein